MRRTLSAMGGLCDAFRGGIEIATSRHRLSAEEAGELLGLSGRHFRRQCARYEAEGDRRAAGQAVWVVCRTVVRRRASLRGCGELYREEYADFTVKHFHEELRGSTAMCLATR